MNVEQEGSSVTDPATPSKDGGVERHAPEEATERPGDAARPGGDDVPPPRDGEPADGGPTNGGPTNGGPTNGSEPPSGGGPRPEVEPLPRPRRRVPRSVIAAGAAVALVAAGAAAYAAFGGDDGGDGASAKKGSSAWVDQAAQRLRATPGFQFSGTLSQDGQPVKVALKVGRTGLASGSMTVSGRRVDVIAIDDGTFIKAGTAFWRASGGESAHPENYAGRWTKAPASMPLLDIDDVLAPQAIAKQLVKARAKAAQAKPDTYGGAPAYRVRTPQADYYLSTAAPYKLLSVHAAGQGDPEFAAAELTDPAPLFAELRPRVARLAGAPDPRLRFQPGKLTFINCDENTNGCTVSVPATLTSPDGAVPSGARAALRATVTSGNRSLGTCKGSGPVPDNRSLVLRCTVTGRAWRTWMKAALDNPGSHPYGATARIVGEAVAADEVSGLLAEIDRQR
ncbi:hypothetical protein J4573_30130 [Actinomadura barringtoniae]|uniref:Uncharacterized protein n=1 Tax=Actinomadura barringtoniae TaxID=1427535 RepID=A0A939PFP9_9ACTN|nr:hypothetical protein [Actinomadura barringtoniae]MBO2451382.1 hypothetical protein [Actinomadura barringtoniae]